MGIYTKGGSINAVISDTSVTRGRYTTDSALRVTPVSGSTFTGETAPDGSVNVTNYDGLRGLYHPSGAIRGFFSNSETAISGLYHRSGALNLYASVSNATLELIGETNGLSLNFLDNSSDIVTSGVSVKSTATGTITFTRASSATRVNSSGLIETVSTNVARLDHDPVTLAPRGLLIEEQRTNLFLYSNDFSNVAWTKAGVSITSGAGTGLDGTNSASKLVETAAAGNHILVQTRTATASAAHSASLFIKAVERSRILFQLDDGSANGAQGSFNLSAGTAAAPTVFGTGSAATSSIENFGNGWYRCRLSCTPATSGTSVRLVVYLLNNSGAASYTGDGTSGVLISNSQLEAGFFSTSYIDTVAATATRSPDLVTIPTSSFPYNVNTSTLISSASQINAAAISSWLNVLDNGTGTHRFFTVVGPNGPITTTLASNAVTQFSQAITPSSTVVPFKHGFTYAANNGNMAVNGVLGTDDTTLTVPGAAGTLLRLGTSTAQTVYFNGHIRDVIYIPRRISNAELQARTTL